MSTILHRYSSIAGVIPSSVELVPRELAINTADGRVYTKKDDGTVVRIDEHGGGVTAHAELTGLDTDSHPQYLNETRGDARYLKLTDVIDGGSFAG